MFCEINKMNDPVPSPSVALKKFEETGLLDSIIETAGSCLNMVLETASSEALDNNKIFVPQNRIKLKTSLKDSRTVIKQYLASLKMMLGGKQVLSQLNAGLVMDKGNFETRWTAD